MKIKQTAFRISDEMKKQLQKIAKKEKRSVNFIVVEALENFLKIKK
jgi:predicted transcriptional regulator